MAKNHQKWSFLMIFSRDPKIEFGGRSLWGPGPVPKLGYPQKGLGNPKNPVLDPSRDPFWGSVLGPPRQIPYLEGLGKSILDPSHQNRSPKPHFWPWDPKNICVSLTYTCLSTDYVVFRLKMTPKPVFGTPHVSRLGLCMVIIIKNDQKS